MRAILIDPEKQTFTSIEVGKNFHEIQRALKCRSFTTGARLRGSIEEGFDAIYASDDPLEERDNPRFWFQVDADRNPPSSFPIAGLGLVLGADKEGKSCDTSVTVEELAPRITFSERKFRGFKVSEYRDGITVDVKAPLIDGSQEKS